MNVVYQISSFKKTFLAAGVESILAASLSRARRLRQSILKSAFEGRLV